MDMESPFFSIIVPCYNSSQYVENAIQSVLDQSFSDFELILVNDGSTDETLMILRRFDCDERVLIVDKQNGGYPSAVNIGLDVASGKYVIMLGSDDMLMNEILSSIYEQSKDLYPDIVFFQAVMFQKGIRKGIDPICDYGRRVQAENISFFDFCSLFPREARVFFQRDTARCFKRALIGNLRYKGITGIDGDAVFSLFFERRCNSFLVLTVEGYHWSIHDDSVSGKPQTYRTIKDRLLCWAAYFRFLRKKKTKITTQEIGILLRLSDFLALLFDLKGSLCFKVGILLRVSNLVRVIAKNNAVSLDDYPILNHPIRWIMSRHL